MVREEKLSIEELDLPASSSSESSNNSEDDNPCHVQEQERNMVPIPTIALEADRYGVSNRATAAISTATLVDYGIINPEDSNNIIDPNKVWRARQQLRKDLRANANEEDVTALFFDGRKDKTLVKEYIEGKWYGDKQTEDHYVLIGEPGTSYLSHITLERGTAACIADGLHRAIEEMGITDNIKAVGADSTPVNTGHRGGAIRLLEIRLGRALQWIICQLHLNELPFRHLCTALIGGTEGPANWEGPIGKALPTCELLPISETGFQSIPDGEPLPEIDLDVLSTDQAYLYKIVTAVRTGVISDDLLREKPGQMSLARWVTTGSRVCRLYVATSKPTKELVILTRFVVCVYGPMWFRIKSQPKCTDAPKHLLHEIMLQNQMPPACKKVTWPVVQKNSYWGHQENVLLAMLADGDMANRQAAVDIILAIRQSAAAAHGRVREFCPPKIRDTVVTLQDLLPPRAECTMEPPLTKHLSEEELREVVEEPLNIEIPGHSQGVERCVKMVTEASHSVYGMEARDGFIRAVVKSRSFMPSFRSKQDFTLPEKD